MRLAKCLHGLGAIGVEVLAVLVLGWVLSVTHPAQGIKATDVCLTSPAASENSLEVTTRQQSQANREIFVQARLRRSTAGLLEMFTSYLSDVFTIPDET